MLKTRAHEEWTRSRRSSDINPDRTSERPLLPGEAVIYCDRLSSSRSCGSMFALRASAITCSNWSMLSAPGTRYLPDDEGRRTVEAEGFRLLVVARKQSVDRLGVGVEILLRGGRMSRPAPESSSCDPRLGDAWSDRDHRLMGGFELVPGILPPAPSARRPWTPARGSASPSASGGPCRRPAPPARSSGASLRQ